MMNQQDESIGKFPFSFAHGDVDGFLDRVMDLEAAIEWEAPVLRNSDLTLAAHTREVLHRFDRFFPYSLPMGYDRNVFRFFLALHDAGKPEAIRVGKKRLQHRYTVPIMERAFRRHGVDDIHASVGLAMVSGDPIGMFLKGHLRSYEASSEIREMSDAAGIRDLEAFFGLLCVYYVCDAGSYPALRSFFADRPDGRVEFSPQVRGRVELLGFGTGPC
jgi:hypothetical protein